jgi:hypothetical protein
VRSVERRSIAVATWTGYSSADEQPAELPEHGAAQSFLGPFRDPLPQLLCGTLGEGEGDD